jgi:dTDP-4-dehydrorhamnose reductase
MTTHARTALLLGATGLVGRAVARQLSGAFHVVGTHHRNPGAGTVAFDLGSDDPEALPLDWTASPVVVVTGAISRLNDCARDPKGSAQVNVAGTLRLLEFAMRHGVAPIFLSSDAVFSGELVGGTPRPKRETDEAQPETEYGRQKRAVESVLPASGSTVLRLSKVTSTSLSEGGFLIEVGQRLKAQEPIQAATDQFLNLALVEDVARVIEFAIETDLRGLWHVAAPPVQSRYQWCVQLAERMGIPSDSIAPCSLLDLQFPESRPRDCSLHGGSLAERLPWKLTTGDDLIISAATALVA